MERTSVIVATLALAVGLVVGTGPDSTPGPDPVQIDRPQEPAQDAQEGAEPVGRPRVQPEPPSPAESDPGAIPARIARGRTSNRVPAGHLPDPGAENTALFLARLYVVESGFSSPVDRAVMIHVLDDRRDALEDLWGRPVGLWEMVDRYSAGRLRAPPGDRVGRLRWILELDRDGNRPTSWPDSMDWDRNAPRWKTILGDARRHVDGHRPPDPCRGLAGFWGGRGTLATTSDAPRGSMERIQCHPDQLLRTYSTARTRRAVDGRDRG